MDTKIVKLQEWYIQLLEDIRKLEYTGIVLTKWNIGKRIVQDELKFGKPEYGSKRIENVARDLKTSSSDLWKCIQFYKKCNTVTQFQDRSWHYIVNTYLPTPRPSQNEITLPLPLGKYNVIYADPPWKYEHPPMGDTDRSIERHY